MSTDQEAADRVPAGRRDRLARVIATRGGKAEPEAPFVVQHREALIYMLCEAAELEHGIMCQYLFAADPAFRSAFASCADWLSRAALALGHASPGAHQAPRSRWSWGPGRAPGASTTAVFGPFKTSAQTEGIGE